MHEDTGEVVDSSRLRAFLDENKIKKDIETYGYYMIITSEIYMPDEEIVENYHRLSRIEDQFRVMK